MVEIDVKNKLLSTLKTIAAYPTGWDGEDSKQATAEAIQEAKVFIDLLNEKGLLSRNPHLSLCNDGEVNFWWRSEGGGVVDVGFYGTGVYSYYAYAYGTEYMTDANLHKEISDDYDLFFAISQLVNR
jgi:hypothetical protein